MKPVFEAVRSCGGVLRETFQNGAFEMEYRGAGSRRALSVYSVASLTEKERQDVYGGFRPEELLRSGKDLLTERLLAEGEPSYARVERLLPRVKTGAYAFFGGAVTWSGIELDLEKGVLYSQVSGNNNAPTSSLFDPATEDGALGRCRPFVFSLDGKLPVFFSVHTDGKDAMELLYFVEAGDPDRDPVVWLRTKRYALGDPARVTLRYQVISRSRVVFQHEIAEETFAVAFADTVAYWLRFEGAGAQFSLPEKQLERAVSGAQISLAVTFAGDHPHYGHRYYGKETHDHFPPNFLWALEMCCVQNRLPWARRILDHLFAYALTDEGRFVYRQGSDELFGASACEYAQLLSLLWRYADALQVKEEYAEQLLCMGEYLLSHLRPCEEADGGRLVYMCAEADSNTRVHAYVNNNLWCVRGLEALGRLLERFGRLAEAERFLRSSADLYDAVMAAIKRGSASDARYGALPPFRIGYTACPLTLSRCRDTFTPVSDAEYEKYARCINMREQGDAVQEYTENCYANYRYYPEMLGSMLLPDDYARGVLSLRENLGGELLCMTRFMGHLDDWPVLHYARFLLERGLWKKYLTLLYAHVCHHGRPDVNCYYEQVDIGGKVIAEDCVPSLLTVPIMAAWMLAYENMAGELFLLSAVPSRWWEEGFSAENLGLSFGTVSLWGQGRTVKLRFSALPEKPFRLTLRHLGALSPMQIEATGARVLACEENALLLSAVDTDVTLRLVTGE